MQTVKATRATDKASEQSGVLQELRVQKAALSSLQEKKAEEEGALEVLQAREKQLSTELQELLSRRTNSGALSFLQEYAESGNAESAERRSQQQAEDDRLARAERSTEMSRKLLRKTSQELLELQKQIQVLKGQQEKVQKEESSKEKLLLEMHQTLAEPVAAEADAMDLQVRVTGSVFEKEAKGHPKERERQSAGLRRVKATIADPQFALREPLREQQQQRWRDRAAEVHRVAEATAEEHGAAAQLEKENQAFREELRSIARADKVEGEEAEAVAQHLHKSMESKEKELNREQEELRREQGEVQTLLGQIRHETAQRDSTKAEVGRKRQLLQESQTKLQSTHEVVSDLKRNEADLELKVLNPLEGEMAQLKTLQAARLSNLQKKDALAREVEVTSRNISDLRLALAREKSRQSVQDIWDKPALAELKEKTAKAKRVMTRLLRKVAQQTGQVRLRFRAKSKAAEAKRQAAVLDLEAMLEAETQKEKKALEVQNRSLAHELLLAKQKDRARVEIRKQEVKSKELRREFQQVKSEEAKQSEKARHEAQKVEVQLKERQKSLEGKVRQKEQAILKLQSQRLGRGQEMLSLQQHVAVARSQEKAVIQDMHKIKEERVRLVSTEEVELTNGLERLHRAEEEEGRRRVEESKNLKSAMEAEETKSQLAKDRKIAQLERDMQKLGAQSENQLQLPKLKSMLAEEEGKGNCQSGSQCRFAHGEHELRDDPDAKAWPGGQRGRGEERSRWSTH
eukprot:g3808.t1